MFKNPFMVRCGNALFHRRNLVFPVVFVSLALAFKPAYPVGSVRFDWAVDAAGLGLALLGQALRVAVIGFAYIKRGGKNKQVYADTLVQEGFFAHSRNPLYVGNAMVLIGLIVIHASPWFILIGIPFYLFAYAAITAAEEDYLGKKFGPEYDAYCRRVPRFIPRFAGLSKTLDGMSFDWRRVIRKEYGSTFTWVACALGLFLWEDFRNRGGVDVYFRPPIAAALLAPATIAYIAARVLKKTGRLGHD